LLLAAETQVGASAGMHCTRREALLPKTEIEKGIDDVVQRPATPMPMPMRKKRSTKWKEKKNPKEREQEMNNLRPARLNTETPNGND